MKHIKKVVTLALAFAMVMSMSLTVLAHTTGSTVTGDKFTYEGTDKTDDGDIKVENATLDTTYTLYKIFDATYSGSNPKNVAYTIKKNPAGGDLYAAISGTDWADYFTISPTPDGDGNYYVTRTGTTATDGTFTPTKDDAALIAQLKTLDTGLFTKIGSIKSNVNGTIEWEKLPYGYFMIIPDKPTETTPVVTIDSNVPTVTVIDKNQTTGFDKNIVVGSGNNEKLEKANDATLNEDVKFRITVQATNYDGTDKIFKYVIEDSLDLGMTYKALPPTIKVGTTNITDATYKYYDKSGSVLTDISGDKLAKVQKFEATINWTNDGTKAGTHRFASNSEINVEYLAYLDPAKADDLVVGGGSNDANTNTADVKYYKGNDTPDHPSGDLPDKETDTYTTKLVLSKVDGDRKALQGAEFTLTGPTGTVVITLRDVFEVDANGTYWKLADGTFTTTDPTSGNYDLSDYDDPNTKYKKTQVSTVTGAGQTESTIKASVGTDGKVSFTGLKDGHYKLVESKVPDGFNKIDDIEFDIGFSPNYVRDSDGKITDYNGKFSVANVTPTTMTINLDTTNYTLYADVVNNKGTELPATGGIGTVIFYVLGAALLIGCGVVLVSKRRMTKEK